MATSRQTSQIIESGLGSKDLEANLSDPGIHSTAVAGRGAAARMFSFIGDLDEMCFFVALWGLWTNTFLHALLVFSYFMQSAPNHESICWSLAVVFWGIVALSVHSIRHARRASKTRDPSNACAQSTQIQIAEALMLTVFIAWYTDILAQKASPYKELFSLCDSSTGWEVGYASFYYWVNPLVGITLSQCDLATAIANVTWVGPIALLFAVWIMLLKWISSPIEVSENVSNATESVSALKGVQLFPGYQVEYFEIKKLECEYRAPEDATFVEQSACS